VVTDVVEPSPVTRLLQLSVIVPLAPAEIEWPTLLRELAALPPSSEIILVHSAAVPPQIEPALPGMRVQHTACAPGRAHQQNHGASLAHGRWLWFVHADSRLQPHTLPALERFIRRDEPALGFFELAFRRDGPRLAALNAWGANLRSRWLKLPFGDQGLPLPASQFAALGRFDETVNFGEDHLLVWAAHHAGLPIVAVGATLQTSARKYAQHGWLRTTLRHWKLTLQQAWPAWRDTRKKA